MKRPLYVPHYTDTGRSKGQPLHESAPVSPTSDVYSIDENENENNFNENEIKQETDSHLVEAPSNNQLVPVKQNSPLKLQIFLIIFGSIVLLAAIGAIISCILLYVNRTSSSSNSTDTSTTTYVTTVGVTATTTTALYSCSNFTVTVNWDYPGNDIVSVSPMTFAVCCSWCLATSSCTTFVFTIPSSTCWLKTSIGGGGSAVTNDIAATR